MRSRKNKKGIITVSMTQEEACILEASLSQVIARLNRPGLTDEDMNVLLPLCEVSELLDGISRSDNYISVLDL